MAIDFATDIANILDGTSPDVARTNGTLYHTSSTSQALNGWLVNRRRIMDPDTAMDSEEADLLGELADLTTIPVPSRPDYWWATGTEGPWEVVGFEPRQAHFVLRLRRQTQPGTVV